jgi:flagellar hook-associated protein 1 FlgK
MSLGLALNNAVSGLRANQQAISVLSHNISNVNTPGYSRQILDQSALYVDGIGSGVRIDDVIRKVDKYLQRAVITQGAEVSRTSVVKDYYDRVQVLLGDPGAQNSLDEYMTGFFNSLQRLAQTADRSSTRSDVIASATTLSNAISGLANDLQELRFQADRDIGDAIGSVNSTLHQLESLNVSITSAGSRGSSVAGLLDQRDAALRTLSQYIDISTTFDAYGAVSVITGDGVGLVDTSRHELRYSGVQSASNLINNNSLNALQVITIDSQGNQVGNASSLISTGTLGNVTSQLTGGNIQGLKLMRDDVLPAMLAQLDQLASNLRDAVNAVHNDGSGFPAATSLTGTRPVVASSQHNWQGTVRIAVLNADGSPIQAPYANESYTGWRPLTLHLDELNSGDGDGLPSMQTIVDEINNHFTTPGTKTSLANLNNIRMASDNSQLYTVGSSLFNFDLELENISGDDAQFFVTGVSIADDGGAVLSTSFSQPAPRILLNPGGAYTTTGGSGDVILNLLSNPTVAVGDTIYLGPPGGANVDGIPAADLTGYFTVQAVVGNSITITANSGSVAATAGTNVIADGSGVYLHEPYEEVIAGDTTRTRDKGELQVDLAGSPLSTFYDITLTVGTLDSDGAVQTSQITYRVYNNQTNLLNDRYNSIAATGPATRVSAQTTQDAMRAILVDENGAELHKINGNYVDYSPSYLKLVTGNSSYTIAIDEMDSAELGDPEATPVTTGSGWGFSHYFGLNDFFAPNAYSATGDTALNSALNMHVSQRLIDNPSLISTGDLVLSPQPADSSATPQWTYRRYAGDNQVIARLGQIGSATQTFDSAGGLPQIDLSLLGYTSEMLGFISSRAAASDADATNAQIFYDGFKNRADAISGVNLDEELANTVIYQNAYSATARIVSVVNQMFDDLLKMA